MSTYDLMTRLRTARGFSAPHVLAAKIARLNAWLAEQRLDAIVVGVSGGVDSALALALAKAASNVEGSPVKRVVALLLPIAGRGATKQTNATSRGRRVAEIADAEIWEAPLGDALASTIAAIERGSGLAFDAWSEGQCLSVMRTPALYGAAALLQTHGYRSIVCGTTNRDEGAYLGFFGKASDAMVDVQLISDLHKSEVRLLATRLGIPDDIVNAVPSGDVHDGRSDEEMIGASYDDVEVFLRLRENDRDTSALRCSEPIEKLHAHNRHKYVVGNPAVHLDVMPRGVRDGWTDSLFTAAREEMRPPAGALPGEWDPPRIHLDDASLQEQQQGILRSERLALPFEGAFAMTIHRALTAKDCERLREAMDRSGRAEPVGVTGVRDGSGYGIGSTRATAWSPDLAQSLFQRIRPALPSVRFIEEDACFTDAFAPRAHWSWRLVGLSPVLRFMRYLPGGRHLCHYDAAYDYGDGRRTLCSVVFYLSDATKSGATRFVRDGQEKLFAPARSYADWDRDTREDEVILRVRPARGDVLVFDHRLCHDVERWDGPDARVIIRADVVYEAIPPSPWQRRQ